MGTINEKINYLHETKNLIKSALISKGINVSDDDTFRSYVQKIIYYTTDATATAEDIVEGKTAYVGGEKLVGTSKNNAEIEPTITSSAFRLIRTIKEIPEINITNTSDFSYAFSDCEQLQNVPSNLKTDNATNMSRMFMGCRSLQEIPPLNTNKVTDFSWFLNGCSALLTVPQLSAEKVKNISNITNSASILNLGGFTYLGKAYTQKASNYSNYALRLTYSINLTHDSIMNVINNLYDLNLNESLSEDGVCQYAQSLSIGETNLAKLTDEEKAIAISKGWTLS